ncbi:unnamed protein product [Ambrosiozyma monospora]|uniref:Unnamed protein product n=1 Tax=Ambrosiozyma monospora TaxID=43982 RepID=A0ACB5T3B8_AMBMO|nr:unnamed protein product [Ambrosiozyma monospora]
MNLKIGDFGLATIISSPDKKRYTICGTPNYIAPEVLGGKNVGHSFEVDVWAVGIMMHALLFGKPPFQAKDVQVIYERIKKNEYGFPEESTVSEEARDLITDILCTNPAERLTLDEILEHEWFQAGPFPRTIGVDSLTKKPRQLAYITKEESIINFNLCKQQVGINAAPKRPVEILKTDLESEKPKALLPNSLSPNNTKSKYREINSPKYLNKVSNKLATAHQENKMIALLDDTLSATIDNIKQVEARRLSTLTETDKPVLVSKWVDYSNKHGFSYQLSNGCTGFLFNDGHSLLKAQEAKNYVRVKASTEVGWTTAKFSGYKSELSKEIEIVEFFERYMSKHLSDVSSAGAKVFKNRDVFLRRYSREENYLMFELSNGSYQFNFKDHHKIVLSEFGLFITHITPSKQIETLPLRYVLDNGNFYDHPDEYFEVKYEFMKQALRQKLTV